MRLTSIRATDIPPVAMFQAEDLTDVIVIAGRNGVGKTRLIQALVNYFRSPSSYPHIALLVEATSQDERQRWSKDVLDTAQPADAQLLVSTLQQSRRRSSWRSSVVQFESDRSIVQVNPYSFSWDFSDPGQENVGWDGTFGGLRSRFQDTLHSIFRMVRSQREQIATTAERMMREGIRSMPLEWPDPLEPFKIAFSQLLAPKTLLEADLQGQTLIYGVDSQRFSINSLSSGEREVVNIVFDFILRNPEDCLVFFDEPELHLHPELSYKLLQALRRVGARNQFLFTTHSPDIITASLDQSVIFIAPPSTPPKNQAVPVREQDETNEALRLLGQSVGIIALGKRLVLIEGTTASLDKQVYGSIVKSRFPDLVLVPSGGKGQITSFRTVIAQVLEKSIWGVDFFMLCDRDSVPPTKDRQNLETESSGRLKVLPRYHLENYFLDAPILAKVFESMEREGSWLRDPGQIDVKLRELARETSSQAVALIVAAHFRQLAGNVALMPKGTHGKTTAELAVLFEAKIKLERVRLASALNSDDVGQMVETVGAELTAKLAAVGDEWKVAIPGRPILHAFASHANLNTARLKQLYIGAAETLRLAPFADIFNILAGFSEYGQPVIIH